MFDQVIENFFSSILHGASGAHDQRKAMIHPKTPTVQIYTDQDVIKFPMEGFGGYEALFEIDDVMDIVRVYNALEGDYEILKYKITEKVYRPGIPHIVLTQLKGS